MNKKRLIQFIAIIVSVIVLIFIWLFISFWNGRRNLQQSNTSPSASSDQYPTASESANWNAPFMKKIEPEFMDKDDKAKMGLVNDPMTRLQILERDKDGNITAYKKVYLDSDIIQYVYDPSGSNAGKTTIIPNTENNASGTATVTE